MRIEQRLLALLLLAGLLWAGLAPAAARPSPPTVRWLVGLAEPASVPGVGLQPLLAERGLFLATLTADERAEAFAALLAEPAVRFVEPDAAAWAQEGPDDPWWPQDNLQAVRALPAWEVVTDTREVVIATLDTGADLAHPDLAPSLWRNRGEVAGNARDDDGNGVTDDVHGARFYLTESGRVAADGHPDEDNLASHGTHVAGIAAAATGNGVGVASLSYGATFMPVKVLDAYGNTTYAQLIRGLRYAADNGARIVNLSLGGTTPSQALTEAVQYAQARGVLVVAASGNCGDSASYQRYGCSEPDQLLYPAALPGVVGVGAVGTRDWPSAPTHVAFSNANASVDVVAPGVDVLSTWYSLNPDPAYDYNRKSGTSMAAPHVSALAALIWAQWPEWDAERVAEQLRRSARDLGPPGWDPAHGAGLVDAGAALQPVAWRSWLPVARR